MGINSYGLFNNGQSGSPYSDRNYELQRQLEARQQQLSDLDKMPSLTARQQEKREQLLHAVDHLSGRLNPAPATKPATDTGSATSGLNSIGRRDTEDGIVIPKSKMDAANAYSKMTPNSRPRAGYAQNEYTNSGNITYKNPGRYDGNATTPQDTYLKGFFVDIKL
jgi:hypothetical protein